MTPAQQPRQSARSAQKPGTVSHQAQQRVDERVKAIMANRDDANSPEDQAVSARRLLRPRVKNSS